MVDLFWAGSGVEIPDTMAESELDELEVGDFTRQGDSLTVTLVKPEDNDPKNVRHVPIEVFVIERNNPDGNLEPELVLDGKEAFYKVQKEYEDQCEEFGIYFDGNEDDPDAACVEIDFDVSFEECTGKAHIHDVSGCNYWEWRITKHLLSVPLLTVPSKEAAV